MPFAVRGGCRLFYELVGDAALPPLVLLRGLARSSRYWAPLVPELAGFRLLLLDNRGVGRSDDSRPPYSARQLADDVASVMDAAGVARAHVFGMSLGGMIAQELALAHAGRIDRLVLGCTSPGGKRAHRPPLASRLAQIRAALAGPEHLGALLISDATLRARPEIAAHLRQLARVEKVRPRGFVGQVAAAVRHDAFDRLAAITHPTLVITGDDDAVIPAPNSRLLAQRIPNATLTVLAGARHDFTTDRPREAGRAVVEFLRA